MKDPFQRSNLYYKQRLGHYCKSAEILCYFETPDWKKDLTTRSYQNDLI